ncbi:hypothetical protein MMC17_000157 [Xylographa soralifera]|nr:hypothetical protein [Xylographa soralifera]
MEFDYYPLGRGPSFALLLLVLFSISTSLSVLVNLVGSDGMDYRHMDKHASTPPPTPIQPAPIHSTEPADMSHCPQRDTHETMWHGMEKFSGWNAETTENWRSMLPNNNGLGQDDSFNDGHPFGIAMFHQIHCLHEIRRRYTFLLGGPDVEAKDIDFAKSAAEQGHISHCFDWVRQALLCHADSTREIQLHLPGGKLKDNTTRTCGNTDPLYEATKNPKAIKEY